MKRKVIIGLLLAIVIVTTSTLAFAGTWDYDECYDGCDGQGKPWCHGYATAELWDGEFVEVTANLYEAEYYTCVSDTDTGFENAYAITASVQYNVDVCVCYGNMSHWQ